MSIIASRLLSSESASLVTAELILLLRRDGWGISSSSDKTVPFLILRPLAALAISEVEVVVSSVSEISTPVDLRLIPR